MHPDVRHKIRVSIMGGCFSPGNVGNSAEFNVYYDPEAAYVVFEAGADVKLGMCPLDLTTRVLVGCTRGLSACAGAV